MGGCERLRGRRHALRRRHIGTVGREDRAGLATALVALEAGDAELLIVRGRDRLARDLVAQEAALPAFWTAGADVAEATGEIVARDCADVRAAGLSARCWVLSQSLSAVTRPKPSATALADARFAAAPSSGKQARQERRCESH